MVCKSKRAWIVALGTAGALGAGAAQARSDVHWSIGIGVPLPGVHVGTVISGGPGYDDYPPPAYYRPPPRYYRPQRYDGPPRYYVPPPYYRAPAPVYVPPPVVFVPPPYVAPPVMVLPAPVYVPHRPRRHWR